MSYFYNSTMGKSMSKIKKIRKTFSLSKKSVDAAEKICAEENRTLSNFIDFILGHYLAKKRK